MAATLTTGQEARLVGIMALLDTDGRKITPDNGNEFVGLIEDEQLLMEPVEQARANLPVYVKVTALKGAVPNPRALQQMTEAEYGTMKVLKYEETRGDVLTWSWRCEAQRQQVT